jgi:hypothetical protein
VVVEGAVVAGHPGESCPLGGRQDIARRVGHLPAVLEQVVQGRGGGGRVGAGGRQARPQLDLELAHPHRGVGRLREQAVLGQVLADREAGGEPVPLAGVQPGVAEVGEGRVGGNPLDPGGDRLGPASVEGEGGRTGDPDSGSPTIETVSKVPPTTFPMMW